LKITFAFFTKKLTAISLPPQFEFPGSLVYQVTESNLNGPKFIWGQYYKTFYGISYDFSKPVAYLSEAPFRFTTLG
jgi:hypothetical protein